MSVYVPEAFAEHNPARIAGLLAQHPFATLISVGVDGPQVSHLPLLAEAGPSGTLADGRLLGHLARANPHAAVLEQTPALAIFHGPHAYVSPRWTTTPSVPTWNYANVHVTGQVRICSGAAESDAILDKLTRAFEPTDGTGWTLAAAADRLDRLRTAIVAFTLDIQTLQAKFKLSQNRPADDRARIADALNDGHTALARLMR